MTWALPAISSSLINSLLAFGLPATLTILVTVMFSAKAPKSTSGWMVGGAKTSTWRLFVSSVVHGSVGVLLSWSWTVSANGGAELHVLRVKAMNWVVLVPGKESVLVLNAQVGVNPAAVVVLGIDRLMR